MEIGPGLGALTTYLLPLVSQLDVVELDRDIITPLRQAFQGLGNLVVHQEDALRFDFTQLANEYSRPSMDAGIQGAGKLIPSGAALRIVGNLPYQISTPLLFHLVQQVAVIQDLHFMLQKEVVERLAALPGSKIYGRLSVMAQFQFEVYPLFTVEPEAFFPPPQVRSQVVRLLPKAPSKEVDYPLFCSLVREAFNHRRKILSNSLKGLVSEAQLKQANMIPHSRTETTNSRRLDWISYNVGHLS